MIRFGFVCALAWALVLAAGPLRADEFRLNETIIEFDPGPGFCRLDPATHDWDRFVIEQQIRMNANRNKVLAIYFDCDHMAKFRTAPEPFPARYGILLASAPGGVLRPSVIAERDAFYRFAERHIGSADFGLADVEKPAAADALSPGLREFIRSPTGQPEVIEAKIFHSDAVALYRPVVFKGIYAGRPEAMGIGISAIALMKGYGVQYTLYDQLDRVEKIAEKTHELKALMQRFDTANQDPI